MQCPAALVLQVTQLAAEGKYDLVVIESTGEAAGRGTARDPQWGRTCTGG